MIQPRYTPLSCSVMSRHTTAIITITEIIYTSSASPRAARRKFANLPHTVVVDF
ncbi:unnamed protein product [Penicillium camemberti]|uniref:Str. FM013 n=1 Tax=Penicillium camemberti (strain FM 013) TaxID=1429867 RepID=A0A0G4NXY0_PENC3|nr:unnamed protein product [Penicillium camemberti]